MLSYLNNKIYHSFPKVSLLAQTRSCISFTFPHKKTPSLHFASLLGAAPVLSGVQKTHFSNTGIRICIFLNTWKNRTTNLVAVLILIRPFYYPYFLRNPALIQYKSSYCFYSHFSKFITTCMDSFHWFKSLTWRHSNICTWVVFWCSGVFLVFTDEEETAETMMKWKYTLTAQ